MHCLLDMSPLQLGHRPRVVSSRKPAWIQCPSTGSHRTQPLSSLCDLSPPASHQRPELLPTLLWARRGQGRVCFIAEAGAGRQPSLGSAWPGWLGHGSLAGRWAPSAGPAGHSHCSQGIGNFWETHLFPWAQPLPSSFLPPFLKPFTVLLKSWSITTALSSNASQTFLPLLALPKIPVPQDNVSSVSSPLPGA